MIGINLRVAKQDDIPALLPLLKQLGYPTDEASLKTRFERFTKSQGYGVAIATIKNEVVGFVAWSTSNLFVVDAVRFHIEGIAVSTNHKSMGIGKKLMQFVEDIAKSESPSIVDLTTGLRRAKDGTHEFYKKLGYHNEGYMAKLYLRKEFANQFTINFLSTAEPQKKVTDQ